MYRTVSNNFSKNEKFDYDMVIFFSPFGVQSFINSFPNFEQGELTAEQISALRMTKAIMGDTSRSKKMELIGRSQTCKTTVNI